PSTTYFVYRCYFFFFFFFSSRRRHTRSYGDWSSDVCSSDLAAHWPRTLHRALDAVCAASAQHLAHRAAALAIVLEVLAQAVQERSEERRVGKEWRCRGWTGE